MTLSMLTPPNKWLLVVGGRAGASSGVPLPFHRTRWAPSIADLVTHHIFRTQSRELFKGLDAALAARKPPLGFIANSLDAQHKFLDDYLSGLTPHTPYLRLADLAKAGMFEAIVTNAPDRLLDRALERVGVTFHEVTAEKPAAPAAKKGVTTLPLFREWDDHVFLDTDERRARESAFVRSRLDELVKAVDAVLVVGMSPDHCELSKALIGAITGRPSLRVVWVDEALVDVEPRPVIEMLGALHPGSEWERVPDLGAFLDGVASEREVPLTPLSEPAPPKKPALARVMNQSWDVRWVLELVPGMVLFWFAIKRIPKISVKMVLSLFALVICIVAFANWRMTASYRDQVRPVEARLRVAEEQLASDDHHLGAVRARTELEAALASLGGMKVPSTIFAIGPLRSRLTSDFARLGKKARTLRDHTLTPLEYRNGLEDRFAADPSLVSMGTHPPLNVHELEGPERGADTGDLDPRGLYVDEDGDAHNEGTYASYRLPLPLARYLRRDRLVLYAPSPPLVHVTLRQAMLDEAREGGRLPLELDFTSITEGELLDQLLVQAGVVAGYVGERAPQFAQGAVLELLEEGRATFYVTHLEVGGVTRNLARVRDLLARFPKARAVIGVSTLEARVAAAAATPTFTFLAVADLSWSEALGFLRQSTGPAYTQAVVENSYLRRALDEPVILSLLVDYHDHADVAPRSLGVLWDRLLATMLRTGDRGVAAKREALGVIAAAHYTTEGRLTRQHATQLIGGDLDAGSHLLDELVADGVVRYRADTWVDFESPGLRAACVAAHLATLPWEERKAFLLVQPDEVVAYHAGILPAADELVRGLLADYEQVLTVLRQADRQDSEINPYVPTLRKAALAVQNGQVSAGVARRVEQLLFELLDHRVPDVAAQAVVSLGEMSSPGTRRFLIKSLDDGSIHDVALMDSIARAPDPVYLGAVERWLARLGTDKDVRLSERAGDFGGMSAAMPGVYDALSFLSQLGSPEALGVALAFAGPDADPRFTAEEWASVRRTLLRSLLGDRHLDAARPLLAEVAKDPLAWAKVIVRLHLARDEPTAQLLLGILRRPSVPDEDQLKQRAAIALSLMPPEIVDPLLQPMLEQDDDTSPFAALVFGYRGRGADLQRVEALARAQEGKTPAQHNVRYARYLRALAMFSSAEAFAIFRELYVAAPNIVREIDLAEHLVYFRTDEASRFALERLVCPARDDQTQDWTLRDTLASHGTDMAHDGVSQIVRILWGGLADPVLRDLCGKDIASALANLERWRADLGGFIDVLGRFRNPSDIPLFADWAASFDPALRAGALTALGRFSEGATARALEGALTKFPTDEKIVWAILRQGRPENEAVLLDQLPTSGFKPTIIKALGEVGGTEALVALYKLRHDWDLRDHAARAILKIATRLLGRPLPREALIEVMTR